MNFGFAITTGLCEFSMVGPWMQAANFNQNVVCKLPDPKTVDFLKEHLGVAAD